MNDDPDDAQFEDELRALRPPAASKQLVNKISDRLAARDLPPIRTAWWQRLGFARPTAALGWGILSPAAAVAVTLAFVRMDPRGSVPSPSSPGTDVAREANHSHPANGTQGANTASVLDATFDEGVVPDGANGLSRRVRYRSTDLVQWRNPRTGAQWEVSYPREDVLLVPINAE